MIFTDIITKKRNKEELTNQEIEFFVSSVTNDSVPDYQISALLMAIVLNGMSDAETLCLTESMAKSGDMLDLSPLGDNTVDKHSTGGVGDKTTLVIAPIVAALGCNVAKMSGKGLGHTGGTIDKLEAIDGYKTTLSGEEFINIAKKHGVCVTGQSGNLTPADKKLYAIRDVTATVESIPLIASSIMSKKLAAGAKNIVLDVKYGSGAFMKTKRDAELLAKTMVKIGKGAERNTAALITNMNTPLGNAIGNSLEVIEAAELLKGNYSKDLFEICTSLAANMYKLCSSLTYDECLARVYEVIEDGTAFKKLCDWVEAQGGNTELLTGKQKFKKSEAEITVSSTTTGFVSETDCYKIGKAACLCGAGRQTLDEKLDLSAGIILHKKTGDYVKSGEPLATLYGKAEKLYDAEKLLLSAYKFTNQKVKKQKLIYKTIN